MLFESLIPILESLPDHDLSSKSEIFKSRILSEMDNAIALAQFDAERYSRTIIHQIRDFDVVLIGWMAGQKSPIHNHPNNGCLVYPILGELLEERFCGELNILSQTAITVGDHSYIDDGICIHRLGNGSETKPAISVHVYSPSNFVPTIFDPRERQESVEILLP